MVSMDHFRHELLAQLGRGAHDGAIDILINSGELSRSLSGDANPKSKMSDCCNAMQEENPTSTSFADRRLPKQRARRHTPPKYRSTLLTKH
jgi:hypothetical protein